MRPSGSLGRSAKRESTANLISSHYLEVEYLLDRVERAATHYQTLAVDRSATSEQIVEAYQQAVRVLHPRYHKVRSAVSDDVLLRIDKSFNKVSQAFFVLTDQAKKSEYDLSLGRQSEQQTGTSVRPDLPSASDDSIVIVNPLTANPVHSRTVDDTEHFNRRRCERIKLSIPALVIGYDASGAKWKEVAKTIDVSRIGVSLTMNRRPHIGAVLRLTMPLPARLRSYGFSDPGYNAYAIVRRVEPVEDDVRIVALELLGQRPPAGYLERPWATFRTERWTGPDRRRQPRADHSEQVRIAFLDDQRREITATDAVTENVSANGARIRLESPSPECDLVRVTRVEGKFESLAMVRQRYKGLDGAERLCVQFLGNLWPAE
jgi:hypothetical protein